MRTLKLRSAFLCWFLFALASATGHCAPAVTDAVSRVSETSYHAYHQALENCGTGQAAGPAYATGTRTRHWHDTPPPTTGNLEAQRCMRDALLAMGTLKVISPAGPKQNVVAELPGWDSLRRDDIYIVSGHFDTTGDINMPGGDDNASGTAGMLEAARALSAYRYGATIRFIAFNGEEGGHYGSIDYATSLSAEERAHLRGVINLDMILHPRNDARTSDPLDIDLWCVGGTQSARDAWMNTFRARAAEYVPALGVDATYDERGSSDHQSFNDLGLPAFTLIEFDVPSWQNGANKEYHTSNDYSLYQPNGAGKGYLKDLHWNFPFATNVIRATVATIAAEAEIAPPIFDVRAEDVGVSAATVRWSTWDAATSQVEYGPVGLAAVSTPEDSTPATQHSMWLEGLTPGTEYAFRAISRTGGDQAASGLYRFTTLKPPVVEDVMLSGLSATAATITWRTDVPATGYVQYGTTTAYGSTANATAPASTVQQAILTGLQPATACHFRVVAENAAGSGASGDLTLRTPAGVPDIVVDNSDTGFTTISGNWSAASATGIPRVGADYIYTQGVASTADAAATARCSWTATIPVDGLYDVYAFYQRGADRTSAAPFLITHAGGQVSVTVDQKTTGAEWVRLAAGLPFQTGATGSVRLSNNCGSAALVGGDAVMLRYAGALPDGTPPATPQGLSALILSEDTIRLGWQRSTDNVAVAGYRVQCGPFSVLTASEGYLLTGLTPNTAYTMAVTALDLSGNQSQTSSPLTAVTKCMPPSPLTVTASQPAGPWFAEPTVSFTAVGGFGPGTVSTYDWVWTASPTHAFTGSEQQWFGGDLPLSALEGENWLHLQARNSMGIQGGTLALGPFRYDSSPASVQVSTDRHYAAESEGFQALWQASDRQSGVRNFRWRLVSPEGAELTAWSGSTAQGCTVQAGVAGWSAAVEVQARNNAGLWSESARSAPVKSVPVMSVPQAKAQPEGAEVMVRPAVVTALFSQSLYVQDPHAYSGVRICATTDQAEGNNVSAAGRVELQDGEPVLSDAETLPWTTSFAAHPVVILVRDLLRAPCAPGLLVTVSGVVAQTLPEENAFLLNDGSTQGGVYVRADGANLLQAGEYVAVTGISAPPQTAEKPPAVLMRRAGGLTTILP